MIAVVGAGLAGLACAQRLQAAGKEVVVLEASDAPGGRMRSDVVDGFVLDRGFQVVLDSYVAVREFVDPSVLGARFFRSGALIAAEGRLHRLESPWENPAAAPGLALSDVFPFADKLRVAALTARVVATSDEALLAGCGLPDDVTTAEFLADFSEEFLERFARPFFGGVFLDDSLSTSAALFRYYFKKFATGRAWIPANGIGALPAAMATGLPDVRFGTRVTGWEIVGSRVSAVTLADGARLAVDGLVLALDEPSLCALLGGRARPARTVAAVYFEAAESLYPDPLLVLPAGRSRVVRHFAQVTNVAPGLAPPGRHLVSASVLNPGPADPAPEAAREIAEIFPRAKLRHLATVRVPYAVPAQPPGFAALSSRPSPAPNVVLAGDWRGGASIQAALESGAAAAGRFLS